MAPMHPRFPILCLWLAPCLLLSADLVLAPRLLIGASLVESYARRVAALPDSYDCVTVLSVYRSSVFHGPITEMKSPKVTWPVSFSPEPNALFINKYRIQS